jgi:hypothetical protein
LTLSTIGGILGTKSTKTGAKMSNPITITITLRQILDAGPCYDPRNEELLPADHDLDAPIAFREIAAAVKPADVVWCFASLSGHDSLKRHFAVDCAERVRHLMTDERSLNVLAVARRYAEGEATDEELSAAYAAAWAARDAAYAAYAARDAAYAAYAARDAAYAAYAAEYAAASAAWAAASAAASEAASEAAYAAASAAWAAASAARDTELVWQARRIIELTDAGRWERSQT